jgi:hypothetical protein
MSSSNGKMHGYKLDSFEKGLSGLCFHEGLPLPREEGLREGQVLVKIHACSLNARDIQSALTADHLGRIARRSRG